MFKIHGLKSSVFHLQSPVLKGAICNSKGIALVLTLMILAIITAMVIEFSYGVYISSVALHNWQTAQRLSFVARSGVMLASNTISERAARTPYTYPGLLEISPKNPFEHFEGILSIRIEDENSKFSLKSLVYANGILNESAYNSFLRLLRILGLNPEIADRVVDWIDPDREPRLSGSETGSKNGNLSCVDEVLLIPGVDRASYEKLLPYVTIYGNGFININGAEAPVLMSLSDSVDGEMAERILRYRKISPFEKPEDILKVAGFETIGQSLMGRIAVQGTAFRAISTGTEGQITRIIEAVLESSPGGWVVSYWKEI